jgi:hypothetical protein
MRAMNVERFVRFARTVAKNAGRYASKRACELALARVNAEHRKGGGYGYIDHERRAAVEALQDRWAELNAKEWDDRMARVAGGEER